MDGRWFGRRRPSSEWRFHRDIFRSRDEVAAIVHTHSPKATSLACTGRGIPAFHYMVAIAGGADIRCAPYHTFGSQELSDAAVAALEGRRACLLANHGVIAVGADLPPLSRSPARSKISPRNIARRWLIGKVRILDETEMRRVVEKFRTYGKQDATDSGLVFGGVDIPSAGRQRKLIMANEKTLSTYRILDSRVCSRCSQASKTFARFSAAGRKIGRSAKSAMEISISCSSWRDPTGRSASSRRSLMFVPQGPRGRCRLSGHSSRTPTTRP